MSHVQMRAEMKWPRRIEDNSSDEAAERATEAGPLAELLLLDEEEVLLCVAFVDEDGLDVREDVAAVEETEDDFCSAVEVESDEAADDEESEEPVPEELVLISVPVPHGIASPVGCLDSGGSVRFPSASAIPNRVVQAGLAPSLSVNW